MRPEQHANSCSGQQTGRSVRHTHHEKPPRGKKGGQQDKSSRAPHPATKTPPRAAQQQQRGGTNAAPQGQGGAAPTYFFLSTETRSRTPRADQPTGRSCADPGPASGRPHALTVPSPCARTSRAPDSAPEGPRTSPLPPPGSAPSRPTGAGTRKKSG